MKKGLLIFLGTATIYLISFLVLGRLTLSNQLVEDSNSTFNRYKWTNNIVVVSNFQIQELDKLKTYFEIENAKVKFKTIGSLEDLNSFEHADSSYYYFLILHALLPITDIEEYENVEEYLATWEKRYIWCFYKWIKLRDVMTGVS